MNLGELFVTIGVKGAAEANKEIDSVTEHGEKAQSKLGKVFRKGAAVVGKAIGAGMAAAGGAIVALGKQAVGAYSDYEQLVGGVETLFGAGGKSVEEYAKSVGKSVSDVQSDYDNLMSAQNIVMENAKNAYKTSGLSANEYMETVTSFSASLIQSVGGDTVKAANIADMAITDMSDNANKMGTSMDAIQTAYNGFAKQNYTMLDNLKLGYGGTKEEMKRLLADAEKLPAAMGQKFDISSFADISQAIHLIQVEMGMSGITYKEYKELVESGAMSEAEAFELLGTTAKEANFTIQGSFGQMKASWQNLLVGLADEKQDPSQLIGNFAESVDILADNLVPRIKQVVSTLGTMPDLIDELLPKLLSKAGDIISELLPVVIEMGTGLINGIVHILPQLTQMLLLALPQLIDGIMQVMDSLISALPEIIRVLCEALPEILPQLIDATVSLFMMLVEQFPTFIAPIVENLPTIFISIAEAATGNLPILIDGVLQLVLGIIDALPVIIQTLIPMIPQIITSVCEALLKAIPQLLAAVGQICWALIDAVLKIFGMGDVSNAMKRAFSEAWEAIKSVWNLVKPYFQTVWDSIKAVFSVVETFFQGAFSAAWEAVKTVFTHVGSFFSTVWTNIKNAFEIKDMVEIGKNLLTGLWNGINDKVAWLKGKVAGVVDKIKGWFTGKDGFDEHSPSKWSEGVGNFVMQGLSIGLKNGSQKVMKTVEDVGTELKKRIETFVSDWNNEASIAKNLYELFLLQNPEATDADKYEAQLASLSAQQEAQGQVVTAVNAEWEKAKELYGENSAEARALEEQVLRETIAYERLGESVRNLNADYQKSIQTKEHDSWLRKSSLVQSVYDLFVLQNPDIEEEERLAKEVESLNTQAEIQSEVVRVANTEYEKAVELYGENSAEAETLRQKLLDEQIAYEKLAASIRACNAAREEAQKETAMKAQKASQDWHQGMRDGAKIGKRLKEFGYTQAQINDYTLQYANAGGKDYTYVPKLASGGLVSRSTLANIGEDGAEAVLPLEKNTGWMDVLASKINSAKSADKIDELIRVMKGLKVYLNKDTLVGQLAPALDASLGMINTMRRRGQ